MNATPLAMTMPGTLATASSGFVAVNPPVLFFVLGVVAALVRSNLSIPKAATKLMALYLLWAIGFKGGVELSKSGLTPDAMQTMGLGLAMAIGSPLVSYTILRRLVGKPDAAAIAACYGSVSVVTFVAACGALQQTGVAFGGHMVAVLALMESPAIVISLILLNLDSGARADGANIGSRSRMLTILHESLLNGPVLLLVGSIVVGVLTGERGYAAFKPLCTDAFPGVLAFFLLDLGILAARRARALLDAPRLLLAFAIGAPLVHAGIALLGSRALGLGEGDAVLLAVLAASASYIAAPAALRLAVPKADPSLYVSLALAVTFPFNLVVGIPLYSAVVQWAW